MGMGECNLKQTDLSIPSPFETYGKITDLNIKKETTGQYGPYPTNQSAEFLCRGCSRAESKETGLEGRDVKRQRKRRQLVTASLPKKWSKALPQMRHSCKSDSQTLAETLPSFLGWRKLCSLAHSLSLHL